MSTERIPLTYAEISPSDSGIKFIARASGTSARHRDTNGHRAACRHDRSA